MNNIISVNDIRIYAYHGCLQEEGIIGANYVVDVEVKTNFMNAAQSDDLSQTIDYCTVYDIVKAEMLIRSRLIENVSWRIAGAIKKKFAAIEKVKVTLSKVAPPVHGDVGKVSVTIEI